MRNNIHILGYGLIGAVLILCSSSSIKKRATLADVIHVPEGYTIEVVADSSLVAYPMFGYTDETGRLFLFESTGNVYDKTQDALTDPKFRVNLLEDNNGDGVYDKSTIFADKVGFPQGGYFYKGSLYISSAPDLLKLTDTDGDGVSDKREVVLTGWTLNVNANSLIGPFMAPDGWLYLTSAINGFDVTTKEGKRLKGETSRIWRVRPDGTQLEWVSAGGMNNPVELTFTEASEPIGTETYFTDPKAGQRDALVYWTEGGIYPKPNKNIDRDSLVRTGDLMPVVSKYSRVAPSGIGRYRGTALGDGFKGNLFSAQFNTHRILRHKLFRDGASFRTEDEVFMWTDREDYHPTDVLEDADGSLLVVETGGWFIKGCPLSQVSKPELKGAIYRIRKNGISRPEDPYGNKIQWQSLQAGDLVSYLADARPFVTDRAVQWIVTQGDKAVTPLISLSQKTPNADVRTKVIFALSRIGTDNALAGVRLGLNDENLQVRVAAARAAGLAKDVKAVTKLAALVQKNDPAVRRQAATALGQIGAPQAVPALITASGIASDAFVRHAVIYALITLNRPEEVKKGLSSPSPRIREAALVALDQMPGKPLKAGQVIPLLSDKSPGLQHTALWVTSHHPEWSNDIRAFLSARLKKGVLTSGEKDSFRDILIAFSADQAIQQFIADQVSTATQDQKLFLLQVMGASQMKTFPQVWVDQISKLLSSNENAQIKMAALDLVRLGGIKSLGSTIRNVVDNDKNPQELRTEGLSILLEAAPKLSESDFKYLYGQLNGKNEAPVRLQAATVLTQAELSEEQLYQIATDYLPKADVFILPRLVNIFKGKHSAKIGLALASTLMNTTTLDSFTESSLRTIFDQYPDEVKPEVNKLLAKLNLVQADRIKYLQSLESQVSKGNLENGRQLFFGKAICWGCHMIGAEGGKLGPDLTSIQNDRSTHDLLEAIIYPNASFVREYETYQIKTKTIEYTGVIQEQSPEAIMLKTGPQTTIRIPRKDIASTKVMDVSMMPQGLDKLLTEQEMADVMAFLMGQDQDPSKDKVFLR
ncbi:PVC-type heme-binding CxxCH protein [Dyadobacter sp. CY347]|uniref:PVC-type heme-binding CxxCH protein n=1 Tax=Dyadobacter sp. CY347 TaxID=2909336 RepID=UPI001F3027F3|nr:PVC-type heme-binding CxxCH protein [Dyadobacter sp. CY347]MCF2491602.1 HEAT repeat domain-containing protein [Dyadobacter sp. CY347]